jgi:AcrR family transcriptional regulator
MSRFQRARKPEEKELRRKAILRSARELAREVGPIELSLNELGRRSGVSKPNIYRYFESREEILLSLFVAELEELVVHLEAGLGEQNDDVREVAACVAHAYLARPLLCQLLGMVSSILEHNLSVEAIAEAKTEIHALAFRASSALARALPWLSSFDAGWCAHSVALYVAGLWPAAHPSRNAAEVAARPEFAALKPDAGRDLRRFVQVMLSGLECLHRPVKKR